MVNVRCTYVLLWLTTGCFSPAAQPGAPCGAGGTGGTCPSGLVCSAEGRCERSLVDADAAVEPDSNLTGDAPIDACLDCSTLVARYHFDGDLADDLGTHGGMAVGDGLTFVPGDVGQALRIPIASDSYVHVADSPAFDIANGEIQLRFRFGETADGDLGLLSRDANGTATDGHFNLRIGHDRRVVLRIQRQSDPTEAAYRCTAAPVAAGVWHVISARFGPAGLVMTVDGVPSDGTSWTDASGVTVDCTLAWDRGIAGNNNPLVLGALSVQSIEPSGVPVDNVAGGVELDEISISSIAAPQ